MGPRQTIRLFYEAHRAELYAYAMLLAENRELAEDAIHSVFYNLLRLRRLPRELRPYVFRCIRNAVVDELRRKGRAQQCEPLRLKPDTALDPALRLDVEQALAALPPDERECIVLKVFCGMTFREIATTRDAPQGTVASWYRRGVARLRTILTESSNEEPRQTTVRT
ncbi:MAG: sigma-70 family RNA polymerase sigma factor [Candidatus Hydrogenedentes bacterium]|nr:sigma-70 family RNA polymerase sigma factor [Candidatus Hydrogenedentota bacterium]